jgi:nicotinamide riboside transporter PnuC
VSRMIERALERWRPHARLLNVLVMCWAGAGLFFAVMAVVFAVSGRSRAERLVPWWIAMGAVGFVVAGLGELARRAVKDGARPSLQPGPKVR